MYIFLISLLSVHSYTESSLLVLHKIAKENLTSTWLEYSKFNSLPRVSLLQQVLLTWQHLFTSAGLTTCEHIYQPLEFRSHDCKKSCSPSACKKTLFGHPVVKQCIKCKNFPTDAMLLTMYAIMGIKGKTLYTRCMEWSITWFWASIVVSERGLVSPRHCVVDYCQECVANEERP